MKIAEIDIALRACKIMAVSIEQRFRNVCVQLSDDFECECTESCQCSFDHYAKVEADRVKVLKDVKKFKARMVNTSRLFNKLSKKVLK